VAAILEAGLCSESYTERILASSVRYGSI